MNRVGAKERIKKWGEISERQKEKKKKRKEKKKRQWVRNQ